MAARMRLSSVDFQNQVTEIGSQRVTYPLQPAEVSLQHALRTDSAADINSQRVTYPLQPAERLQYYVTHPLQPAEVGVQRLVISIRVGGTHKPSVDVPTSAG